MVRRGTFTGGGSLDPFGGTRGGLGRYNITGETVSSLASFETYAVQVAWANGDATDAQYLTQLQKMVDLAPAGTREQVTAMNTLHDAQYTIGKNKVVRDVNNAVDHKTRQTALGTLLAFEKAHLATMTATDSQAYRNELDTIASVRGEIRQDRYNTLLETVNKGGASTKALRDLATSLYTDAVAAKDPDVDEWGSTVDSLNKRMKDEATTAAYQAYQHNRMTGQALLGVIDANLAALTPGSPDYVQLAATREDLATQVKNQDATKADAVVQQKRSAGSMTDADYLKYLSDSYAHSDPGTADWITAGTRLSEFTFSLAEDKLRYDVQTGKRPVSALVSFYSGYLKTMNPGSERYRTIAGAIYSLTHGASGGGGGSSSGSKNGALLKMGPLIDGKGALADLTGGKGAPPNFANLFRIDPTNAASWHWWENNRSSMAAAFSDGRSSWTYFDPAGKAYVLPFNAGMMSEMDALNQTYAAIGLKSSTSVKEAQTWVGRVISGSNAQQSRGAQYAKDSFDKTWTALEGQKTKLLASGRLSDYYNLVQYQNALAKQTLSSPFITNDDRDRINTLVAKIAPYDADPGSATFNLTGDKVLGYFHDGLATGGTNTINATFERDPNTGAVMATGAVIDPQKAFLSQGEGGIIGVVPVAPGDYRTDPSTNSTVPNYYQTHVAVQVVDPFGGLTTVWQPIVRPGDQKSGSASAGGATIGLPVWQDPGQAQQGHRGPPGSGGVPVKVIYNGHQATIPVFQVTVWQRTGPQGTPIATTWVTLSDPALGSAGSTWLRLPQDGSGGQLPRIILPTGVTLNSTNGNFQQGGKDVSWEQVLSSGAHFWSAGDSMATGTDFGAPGVSFETRSADSQGGLNLGVPEWQLTLDENAMSRRGAQSDRLRAPASWDSRSEAVHIAAVQPNYDTNSEATRIRQLAATAGPSGSLSDSIRRGGLLPIDQMPTLRPLALAPSWDTNSENTRIRQLATPTLAPLVHARLAPIAKSALAPLPKSTGAGKAADDLAINMLPTPTTPVLTGGGGGGAVNKVL